MGVLRLRGLHECMGILCYVLQGVTGDLQYSELADVDAGFISLHALLCCVQLSATDCCAVVVAQCMGIRLP